MFLLTLPRYSHFIVLACALLNCGKAHAHNNVDGYILGVVTLWHHFGGRSNNTMPAPVRRMTLMSMYVILMDGNAGHVFFVHLLLCALK